MRQKRTINVKNNFHSAVSYPILIQRRTRKYFAAFYSYVGFIEARHTVLPENGSNVRSFAPLVINYKMWIVINQFGSANQVQKIPISSKTYLRYVRMGIEDGSGSGIRVKE